MRYLFLGILVLLLPIVSANQAMFNGTVYYENYTGAMVSNTSHCDPVAQGYSCDFLGLTYNITWTGSLAYDSLQYPNKTFLIPWTFPHLNYWKKTGQNWNWAEVIPITNTFEQSQNQIVRRMIMGDGSKMNITYNFIDNRIKQTWEVTSGQPNGTNFSVDWRADSAASASWDNTSNKYAGFDVKQLLMSWSDISGYNVSTRYESGNRKFFMRVNLSSMNLSQRKLVDPSYEWNGTTAPAWNATTKSGTVISNMFSGKNNIILNGTYDILDRDSQYTDSGGEWNTWTTYSTEASPTKNTTDYVAGTNSIQINSIGSVIVAYNNIVDVNRSAYSYFIFWLKVNKTGVAWDSTNSVYLDSPANNRWVLTGNLPTSWTLYQLKKSDMVAGNFNLVSDLSFNWASNAHPITFFIDGVHFAVTPYNSTGNITMWWNSGSGRQVASVIVNATTPTNTNYTLWYANNGTGSYSQIGGTLTGNTSNTITGTKYQNTDVQIRLAGNLTATPELMNVTMIDEASGGTPTPTPIQKKKMPVRII